MKLIRAQSLLSWKALKESRDLDPGECIHWSGDTALAESTAPVCCISHRWTAPDRPDPDGAQLRELQSRLQSLSTDGLDLRHALVFYDYSSMVQRPRTADEDAAFERDLAGLDRLFLSADRVIVLSEGYADYKSRAWCFLELILAEANVHLFDDQAAIRDDLDFRSAFIGDTDQGRRDGRAGKKTPMLLTDMDMTATYKLDPVEAEIIIAIFQHLGACRVTHSSDLPLIRQQMARYFQKRRLFPFGKLLVGVCKFFDVSFVMIHTSAEYEPFVCRPYFQEPDWIRLPRQRGPRAVEGLTGEDYPPELAALVGKTPSQSVFALSPTDIQAVLSLAPTGGFYPALRLSRPGVEDHQDYIMRFQNARDWGQYMVKPADTVFGKNKYQFATGDHSAVIIPLNARMGRVYGDDDCFPTVEHVVHTLLNLNWQPGLITYPDCIFLLLIPGAAAPAPQPSTTSETGAVPPAANFRLVVVRGLKRDTEYPIRDGKNYIGRADEKPVDIDLEDQESSDRVWSSRQHALIVLEDGRLTIEDLNSSNGTFLNRARIQPGLPQPLRVNDVVQIGTVQMKVLE